MPSIRASRRPLLLALASLAGGPATAQTLVRDVNAHPPLAPQGSTPTDFVELGGQVFFAAAFDGFGSELAVSDGTAGGTALLRDVAAGETSASPRDLTVVGDRIFFAAFTAGVATELWATDGTAPGTHLVKDINPGALSGDPRHLAAAGGVLYFRARDGAGVELWRSDGTAAGTYRVKDISPQSSTPRDLTEAGGLLFFTADDGTHGREPWVSDGTEAGTILLGDLQPGGLGSTPEDLVALGGELYFSAQVGGLGRELWKSDGTPGGTVLVADVGASISGEVDGLTVAADEVFFAAAGASFDRELWKTDGTTAGTVQVADVHPGGSSDPENLTAAGGLLFFTADDGTHGRELWVSDGTAAGTVLVADLEPGPGSPTFGETAAFGGELILATTSFSSVSELWKSDGTAAGTQLLLGLAAGGAPSVPRSLAPLGGTLWFSAFEGDHGREPWTSDGTAAGTALLADLLPGPVSQDSDPLLQAALLGRAIFTADDGVHGVEPWVSDGTEAGTQLLLDVAPGPETSFPAAMTLFQDRAVFTADAATGPIPNRELWATDGTPAGTGLVGDLDPVIGSDPAELYATDEQLYFSAFTVATGREPWTWDGVEPPRLLADIHPEGSSGAREFFALDDVVLFAADDRDHGSELWRTDGTMEGTALVEDLWPGMAGSQPHGFVPLGDVALFTAGIGGDELWRTDGTEEGTFQVTVIDVITPNGGFHSLTPSGGLVFLLSDDGPLYATDGTAAGTVQLPGPDFERIVAFAGGVLGAYGAEVWYSDGTPPGTVALYAGHVDPDDLAVAGDAGYFSVLVPPGQFASNERQLWVTDGTAGGTQLLHDFDPDAALPSTTAEEIRSIHAAGQGPEIVLTAIDVANGAEVWLSDGTSAGTALLADVRPGPGSAFPTDFMATGTKFLRAGDRIYFQADDGTAGVELHALPFESTGGHAYAPFGHACAAAATGIPPSIGASGAATLGGAFDVELADAPPATAALLYYSLDVAPLDLGGCTLYLGLPFSFVDSALTDGAGGAAATIPVPSGTALLGLPIHLQWVVADPGGPVADVATLSDALEVLVGP